MEPTINVEGVARASATPRAERSLYERLGGGEAIRRIVDDIMDLHLANPIVSPRFAAVVDQTTMRRHATEFFCAGTGGTEAYSGREMAATHTGMNISEQEFMAVLDDILLALQRNRVGEKEQSDVLAILYGMKADILRR